MDKSPGAWAIEPLKKYATFSGRARRAEYWWFFLFGIAVAALAAALDAILDTPRTSGANGTGLISGLTSFALLLPQFAVTARRLHDTDRSGWWMLLPMVAVVPVVASFVLMSDGQPHIAMLIVGALVFFAVLILLLVWYATRGTVGDNRFGPDPLVA